MIGAASNISGSRHITFHNLVFMLASISAFSSRTSLALSTPRNRIARYLSRHSIPSSKKNGRAVKSFQYTAPGFCTLHPYQKLPTNAIDNEQQTALCALGNEDPFGEDSSFSLGTKTNPDDFRDISARLYTNFSLELENNERKEEESSMIHPSQTMSSHATELKEELQRFRTQQSETLNKPPYSIFTNASLEEICESLPTTKETLLQVKGIGPKKVEMFGARILNIVSSHSERIKDLDGVSKNSSSTGEPFFSAPKENKKSVQVRKMQLKEDLKQYRMQQAQPMNKPPYQIFTNAALDGIYAALPTTEAQLLEVKGIGPKKVEMFGEDILAIVSKYVESGDDDHGAIDNMTHIPIRPTVIDTETLTSEQRNAAEIVLGEDRKNLFITGSAGTGKSHLLKYLVQELKQRKNNAGELNIVGIGAPTGVAAIIVGGSTLHSFFGIGLGTGSISSVLNKVNKNSTAKKRIDETDVLIIDECSMMSSDLLEKLDAVAREYRKNGYLRDEPFGGMQVIAFGDFFQLPPVEKRRSDWNDNARHERSFCFNSHVWTSLGLHKNVVELKEVQRQENEHFVSLLNKVRVGEVNESDVQFLNSKCLISKSKPLPTDGIIPTRLYVLNRDVDSENMSRLQSLKSEEIICRAVDRWKETLPVGTSATVKKQMKDALTMELPDELRLKVGAQVMLTRNKDLESNLVNGSRGIVERFIKDGDFMVPIVRFDSGISTKVPPVESVRYNPDGGDGCLVRMQIPLKLAWAITIHKSQGSTLTRAMLDISSAFEFGQCYVALSRVKSLDGLWLERPANLRNIMVSPQVIEFFQSSR